MATAAFQADLKSNEGSGGGSKCASITNMAACGKIPLVVAKWMWKAGEKKTMEGCVMSQRRPSQHRRGKHTLSSLMTSPELGSVEGDMVCISRRGGGGGSNLVMNGLPLPAQ